MIAKETQMKQELTDTLQRLIGASVVIGNLPERPGYNGSILQIDNEEAERIASDLTQAAATLEKAQEMLDAKDAEIAKLQTLLDMTNITISNLDAHNRNMQIVRDRQMEVVSTEIAALRQDAYDICMSRSLSLSRDGKYAEANEASKCASAVKYAKIDAAMAQAVRPS